MALFTTSATEDKELPRLMQQLESSHIEMSFAPLLALQDMQQRAMLPKLTIRASLTMCSHDGLDPLRLTRGPELDAAVDAVPIPLDDVLLQLRRYVPSVRRAVSFLSDCMRAYRTFTQRNSI